MLRPGHFSTPSLQIITKTTNFYFTVSKQFKIQNTLVLLKTRRYDPLRRPMFSSCRGLWHSAKAFGKKFFLCCLSQKFQQQKNLKKKKNPKENPLKPPKSNK